MNEVAAAKESLLIFSDVHLGSDLNDAGPVERRSESIDRDLVRLIAHYRAVAAPSGRWKIIIAGDFIDLTGMVIDLDGDEARALATPPTEEELRHGVGSAEDHARLKLRRVARRHADVFAELAAFVADGHAITIISGNHDIELHWDGVKDELRSLLFAALDEDASCDRASFHARVEFAPLFFYRDGVVYVEHGHQYDPFCSTALPIVPVSPLDPRRIALACSDILVRFVVRRTEGMKEYGHEHMGVASYLRFAARLGVRGMFALGARFVRSVAEMFRVRRAYLTDAARALRAEHARRALRLADATQIGRDRLAQLFALHAKPIAHSIRGILASVLLDRLALGLFTAAAVGALLIGGARWPLPAGVVGLALVSYVIVARARVIDPAEQLVERATQLARIFPAAFVVMGHTHVPTTTAAGHATYINLGSWAEGEGDGNGDYRAPRTHLVIHEHEGRVEAQFCEWRDGEGPRVRTRI